MRLSWNIATSFGLGGYLLAGCIAWTYLGLYWVYLPAALVALLTGYVDDVTAAGWGYGPFYSLEETLEDFVLKPLLSVLIFGGWIALILGVASGVVLYFSSASRRSAVSSA